MSYTRRGFTVLELIAALAGLAVAMVIVTELALACMADRKRNAVRDEALEAATNVLEGAQANSWEALTPEWAAAQKLPDELAERMYQPRLTVRVETEGSRPRVKRVTVEIAWQLDQGVPAAPVVLDGWFAARTAPRSGGKP